MDAMPRRNVWMPWRRENEQLCQRLDQAGTIIEVGKALPLHDRVIFNWKPCIHSRDEPILIVTARMASGITDSVMVLGPRDIRALDHH